MAEGSPLLWATMIGLFGRSPQANFDPRTPLQQRIEKSVSSRPLVSRYIRVQGETFYLPQLGVHQQIYSTDLSFSMH